MKRTAVVLGVAVVLVAALVLLYLRFRPTEAILADFFDSTNEAEDQLADPLILSDCGAAGQVARGIADPALPLRRYAIGYLGNRRCAGALPALASIVRQDRERNYFRADALEAIAQIDRTRGVELAHQYESRTDYLGQRARAILAGEEIGLQRTYWQALRGVHE